MSGKLIVLEGLDGCGKSTQTELLPESLADCGYDTLRIKLPNYEDESSALVRQYLAGEFGDTADGLSPYAASSFYAVDRVASYRKIWMQDYLKGSLILADRYTTSNAIYQMNKLPKNEWDGFLNWICDFEYVKLGLPEPDAVIYLDVPLERSKEQLAKRYNGDMSKKDIHERDEKFLIRCREAAMYAAEKWAWKKINCMESGSMRSVADIQDEIRRTILTVL